MLEDPRAADARDGCRTARPDARSRERSGCVRSCRGPTAITSPRSSGDSTAAKLSRPRSRRSAARTPQRLGTLRSRTSSRPSAGGQTVCCGRGDGIVQPDASSDSARDMGLTTSRILWGLSRKDASSASRGEMRHAISIERATASVYRLDRSTIEPSASELPKESLRGRGRQRHRSLSPALPAVAHGWAVAPVSTATPQAVSDHVVGLQCAQSIGRAGGSSAYYCHVASRCRPN
jgi:hypothetical protein